VTEDIINCLSNVNVPALRAWHTMRSHMRRSLSRGEFQDYEDLLLEAKQYEGELEDDLPGTGSEKVYSACPGAIDDGGGAYSVGFEQEGGTPQGNSAQQAGATAGGTAAEPLAAALAGRLSLVEQETTRQRAELKEVRGEVSGLRGDFTRCHGDVMGALEKLAQRGESDQAGSPLPAPPMVAAVLPPPQQQRQQPPVQAPLPPQPQLQQSPPPQQPLF